MALVLALTVLSLLPWTVSLPISSASSSRVAAAWYAGWATDKFPLSAISWDKYNTLIYSFAVTTSDVNSLSLDASNPSVLPQFVSQAHDNGVAAHLGIGGWTGSVWFSSNVATAENRTAFVQTVVNLVKQYGLDGINFDWEYPNQAGIGWNTQSSDDTDNFLSFLQELRADSVGAGLTLSAATSITPFHDASGKPSTDVSGFAKVLDYIMVMNYDVWGSWSPTVGPNAPLEDSCAPSGDQLGSATSALKAWSSAGMPASKIVLGVAAYGHAFSVSPSDAFESGSTAELALYPRFDASHQPEGDASDATQNVEAPSQLSETSSTFEFWDLVHNGFLTTDGSVASGIHSRFDDCSQTPFVYNQTTQVMVSYDSIESFTAKGSFIKQNSLGGFAMWEAGGDYNDILLNSIRSAAGY